MHPSERIRFEKSEILKGKKIAMAITGSIAAVEAVKIARELIRHGADVYPYATPDALRFIGKDSLEFATGHDVIVELTGNVEHLQDLDLVLVAPATADIISKAACGIADDSVSTLILANIEKCVFVPAMNERMYENPFFLSNLEKIRNVAYVIEGESSEEEIKIPDREEIAAHVMHILGEKLRNRKILVIGGAGYEKIDDFRIITNLSTGKTAIEIAKHAYYLGGDVTLLMGLSKIGIPSYIRHDIFSDAKSLISLVKNIVSERYDAIIVPAALPDFSPERKEGKIEFEEFEKVKWRKTPKFLEELRKEFDGILVAFKAETKIGVNDLIKEARKIMEKYNLNFVVANLLEDVKENTSRVFIVDDEDFTEISGSKEYIAQRIVERVADEI